MVEPEMAYADLDDVIALAEGLVVEVIGRVLDRRARELKTLERDTTRLAAIKAPFARVSYDDAAMKLREKGLPFEWGGDFGSPDETALSEMFDGPVAVTGYPAAIKAFYFKPDEARPEISKSVDILAPEGYGEIIGGSQREDDYDKLLARIRAEGLPEDAYGWYLDLRKYGTFVHAGFGLGVERTVAWICGIPHIREAIAFPRTLYKLWP